MMEAWHNTAVVYAKLLNDKFYYMVPLIYYKKLF